MPGWGVSVSEVSECHTGAHKILDTQADHCPHNNLASLLLTATPVSKQTIIPLELYTVYIYYRDTHVKVKIHHAVLKTTGYFIS